jgi:uncharacterized cupin superfamily protein
MLLRAFQERRWPGVDHGLDCTEDRFNWYYDFDETILILEGSIVLESEGMKPVRCGPGDVIFFKDGVLAKWHVESHVKKLAKTQPVSLGFAPARGRLAQAHILAARKI